MNWVGSEGSILVMMGGASAELFLRPEASFPGIDRSVKKRTW